MQPGRPDANKDDDGQYDDELETVSKQESSLLSSDLEFYLPPASARTTPQTRSSVEAAGRSSAVNSASRLAADRSNNRQVVDVSNAVVRHYSLCLQIAFYFYELSYVRPKKKSLPIRHSLLQQPVLQSASDVSECVSLRTNENNWLKFANVAFHAAPAAWDSQTGYFQGTILQLFCSKPNRVLIVFSCFLFRICLVSLLMQTDDRIVNIISFDLI